MSDLSDREIEQLHRLEAGLRFARAELTADVTAQRLLILLCVYFNQGMSQRELLTKLDSTSITALSRNLADLSAWTTRKTDGPNLIELRPEPMNLRIKRVYLTDKGEQFVRRWLAATEDLRNTHKEAR
ncbi:MAG: hypothetical protein HKN77_04700 [Woeseiaceae bacterium]|nr:hypothetical protein [Woeseiaceae bacterium]